MQLDEIKIDSILEGEKGKYTLTDEVLIEQDVEIFKGINEKDNREVFIKTQKQDFNSEQKQISIRLAEQNLLHVVQIIEVFYSEKYKRHCIITEYTAEGDLFKYNRKQNQQKNFNQQKIREWMQQIVRGVQELHNQNYIHRDLKVQNIVVFKDKNNQIRLKICDFGLTRSDLSNTKTKKVGTPYYMAPEILTDKYDLLVDIWSLGIIWYYLLTNKLIFAQAIEKEIYQQIESSNQGFIDNIIDNAEYQGIEDVYDSDKDLLKQMLSIDPAKRPDTQVILQRLNMKPLSRVASQIQKVKKLLELADKVEQSQEKRIDSYEQIKSKLIEEMENLKKLYRPEQKI